ncbi:TPA_asm: coat protein [ssRNA phage SRR6960509_3]|uniref:Coat protein n=1 Tax=ssRNA phage SRR6960509_3 TaxID=2786530 RepID=A0A8S5L024_9VIRU|nr:coat protein [ssRNA phage SRR6960509_3]DAD50977.1 TPA_asm: coat protein [ssRNA phage SRR6960509_3]
MSKSIDFGYTDTAIGGSPTLNLLRGSVNFGADFRVKTDKKDELVLTNITSPIDRPEKFRIAYSVVENAYTGSGISPGYQAPSLKGASVLIQLTEVASITDSEDPSFRVDAPISVHCVVKVPAIEELTETHIQTVLARMLSGFYETGSTTTTRLKALIRGSLIPTDL